MQPGNRKKEGVTESARWRTLALMVVWGRASVVAGFEVLVPYGGRHAELAKHLAWSGYAVDGPWDSPREILRD